MTCSLTAPCGGIWRYDLAFHDDQTRQDLSREAWVCLAGHRLYGMTCEQCRGIFVDATVRPGCPSCRETNPALDGYLRPPVSRVLGFLAAQRPMAKPIKCRICQEIFTREQHAQRYCEACRKRTRKHDRARKAAMATGEMR